VAVQAGRAVAAGPRKPLPGQPIQIWVMTIYPFDLT